MQRRHRGLATGAHPEGVDAALPLRLRAGRGGHGWRTWQWERSQGGEGAACWKGSLEHGCSTRRGRLDTSFFDFQLIVSGIKVRRNSTEPGKKSTSISFKFIEKQKAQITASARSPTPPHTGHAGHERSEKGEGATSLTYKLLLDLPQVARRRGGVQQRVVHVQDEAQLPLLQEPVGCATNC